MTNKGGFKFISFLITTILYGCLGYILYYSIKNGDLFLDNSRSFIIESIIILSPLVLSIIWSIIEKRKPWIGAVLTIVLCTFLNSLIGEKVTREHIPLYILSLAIPYICCICAIFRGRERKRSSSYSSSSSSSSSSSYSGSSDDAGSYYSGSSYSGSYYSDSGSTTNYDDCGAYGYPIELGPSYHPDHMPIDVSDM